MTEIIPISEYYKLPQLKQKVNDFKNIARYHNIKIKSKRKQDIINEIYEKMKSIYYVIKIQKQVRIKLRRMLIKFHGPAYCNPDICVNDTDFYTLDTIKSIPPTYLFSYKDENDGMVYGFHYISFLKLALGINYGSNNKQVENPYTRKVIQKNIMQSFAKYIYLSKKIYNMKFKESFEDEVILNPKIRYQQRLTDIFSKIDSLGNYSQIEWYDKLHSTRVIRFIRELRDIWQYRLNLTQATKYNILGTCDPFIAFNTNALSSFSPAKIKNIGLNIIEKFITSGINEEYKTLGSIYILSALTIVSQSAAAALPHLYESVI